MTNYVDDSFISLSVTYMFSSEKCQFRSFIHSLISLLLLSPKCSILVQSPHYICFVNTSLRYGLFFQIPNSTLQRAIFDFNKINSWIFSFIDCAFSAVSRNSSPNPRSCRFYPMFSSKIFTTLNFRFSSLCKYSLYCLSVFSTLNWTLVQDQLAISM